MRFQRIASTLTLLLFGISSLYAHFVFVSAQPGGTEARVVMSEDVKPDLDVKMIASTKLFLRSADGSTKPLTLSQPEKNYFTAPIAGQGTRVVYGKTEFGVMQRGESKPYLLVYYPKSVVGDAFSGATALGKDAPVELQAAGDASGIRFKLMAFGKPVADAEVVVLLPDGRESKVKTDAAGETDGEFQEKGQYAVWARYWQDASGEHGGKPYEQIRHYATLVVDTNDALITSAASEVSQAREIAKMPVAAASFGAVATDGWLYVYGGHTAPTHVYSKDSVSGRFDRMRLGGDPAWETLPGGPGLQGLNLTAHQGSIYRVGGMQPMNEKGKAADNQSVAEVARFDIASGRWESLPPLPEPLSSHDVVTIGNTLYVVGGWWLKGKEQVWNSHLLTLELGKREAKWQQSPQPFHRRALMAAAYQEKLWVVGGIADDGKVSRAVSIYNPATKAWTEGPELPEGQFLGFSPAVGVHDGSLFVCVADGRLLRLNAAATDWEKVGEVSPRVAHRLVSSGDHVLILGGASKGKNLDGIEAIAVSKP